MHRLNDIYFEGKLQPLPFKISNARIFLGLVRCKREKNFDDTWHYYDFEFVVSPKCENTEGEHAVEDVIIHEMIHYYILSNQMQDNGPHGNILKGMMQDINKRFNHNISVTHKKTREEEEKDDDVRQHLLCVVRFRTNQYGIAVSTRTRLFELWDIMPTFSKAAEVTWYVTTDPFFNRYPRITKPKLCHITRAELDEHLVGAKKLVRNGNVIKVEK